MLLVRLIHIFFLGIFLIVIGIARPQTNAFYWVCIVLGILGLSVFLIRFRKEEIFWSIWHILVATLLLWIGIMGHHAFPFLFKLMILLGSAAIGYHTIRLLQDNLD